MVSFYCGGRGGGACVLSSLCSLTLTWPWWWFFHLCSPSCSALPYPSISCLAAGIVLTPCTSQEGFLSLTTDESLALAGGLWGLRHVTPCPCRCQLVGWAGPLLQNLPLHCHDSWFSQRGGKVCLFGPWKSSHFGAATSGCLGVDVTEAGTTQNVFPRLRLSESSLR